MNQIFYHSELYDIALAAAEEKTESVLDIKQKLDGARAAGDYRASYALATWYLFGKDGVVEKDLTQAVILLNESLDGCIACAAYDLAVCFEKGKGIIKSERRALELYVKAAFWGDAASYYEVSRMYYYGLGITKDEKMAKLWEDEAERRGYHEGVSGD